MASYKRVHAAWAKKLEEDEKPAKLEKYNQIIADNPELKGLFTFTQYCNKQSSSLEVEALRTSTFAICYYFTCEYKGELSFDNERSKTVWQVVKTNANYYNNVIGFMDEETDEEYLTLYDAIRKKLDNYFDLAAEEILEDVYGKEYVDFKAEYIKARSSKSVKKAK
jgi:hypothetical protein